ncbi:MAG: hypothetical protein HYU51_12770 [Candidatus Rokubacteria bacterium]|nr:hypothetical protein [Candidatus Rokubacteria bacterium]
MRGSAARSSVASRKIAEVVARVAGDARRAGIGLLVYSALLLVASLLLATSWVPSPLIVAAAVVCVGHASAGLALIRQSVWRHAIVATSGGLHVVFTVAWVVVLVVA